jgi:hypothetical protein
VQMPGNPETSMTCSQPSTDRSPASPAQRYASPCSMRRQRTGTSRLYLPIHADKRRVATTIVPIRSHCIQHHECRIFVVDHAALLCNEMAPSCAQFCTRCRHLACRV